MCFAVWFGVRTVKSRCQPSSAVWPKKENKFISLCFTVLTHDLPILYEAEAGPRKDLAGGVVFHPYSNCFFLEASRLNQTKPTQGLMEPRALTEMSVPRGRSTLFCLLFYIVFQYFNVTSLIVGMLPTFTVSSDFDCFGEFFSD